MTKAAVVAMDSIQNLTGQFGNIPQVNKFVVSGASKRGTTLKKILLKQKKK